jgi:hypothetical protein
MISIVMPLMSGGSGSRTGLAGPRGEYVSERPGWARLTKLRAGARFFRNTKD